MTAGLEGALPFLARPRRRFPTWPEVNAAMSIRNTTGDGLRMGGASTIQKSRNQCLEPDPRRASDQQEAQRRNRDQPVKAARAHWLAALRCVDLHTITNQGGHCSDQPHLSRRAPTKNPDRKLMTSRPQVRAAAALHPQTSDRRRPTPRRPNTRGPIRNSPATQCRRPRGRTPTRRAPRARTRPPRAAAAH